MLVALLLATSFTAAPEPCDPRGDAIKAIRQLGGTYVDRGGRITVSFQSLRIMDADLQHLKHIPDLAELNLCYTPITNAALVHIKGLTNLTNLEIYSTAIDDDGVKHLFGLKKLNFLLAKQTNVTPEGARKLKLALPDCETISVSPRTPAIAMPAGKWTITFANGVVQSCEIGADGAASASEPLRSSTGQAYVQGLSAKLIFRDDRVERWTPVGSRMVVEHWAASADFPAAAPVLGIAEKAP